MPVNWDDLPAKVRARLSESEAMAAHPAKGTRRKKNREQVRQSEGGPWACRGCGDDERFASFEAWERHSMASGHRVGRIVL